MTRASALLTSAAVLATAMVAALGAVVLTAGPAAAHASLIRSSPVDGSALARAPRSVSLTFDENVRMPSVIVVTDDHGASVTEGKTSVVDKVASTRVRIVSSGTFTVAYRVLSADGHPVTGRIVFTVGAGGGGVVSGDGQSAVEHVHSGQPAENSSSGRVPTRVAAMIAALALLGGIGLLTVRRWAPNLWGGS